MASRVTAIWPFTSASSDICAKAGSLAAASSVLAEPSSTTPESSTFLTRRPWRPARAWRLAASPLTITWSAARVGDAISSVRSFDNRARCCAAAGIARAKSSAAANNPVTTRRTIVILPFIASSVGGPRKFGRGSICTPRATAEE